eukprot:10867757-Prorocentrum_lima.AAC.1
MEAAKVGLAVQASSSGFATDDTLTVGRDISAAPLDTGDVLNTGDTVEANAANVDLGVDFGSDTSSDA